MRKIINKIGFLLLTLMFFMVINTRTVFAAGTSLGGTTSATIGDTVSITVNINGDSSLYNTEIGISYDPSILEFVLSDQNTENGGGGTVRIVKTGSGNSISHTLKFKAIAAGTANISIAEARIVYTSLEQAILNGASMSVTVNAPKTASANNSLSSLQISPGTLSPAFSSKTLSYSATVENSVTKIAVTAVPEDGGAQVTGVSGSGDLKVGSNAVKISVTAENGSVATYTINVTRQAGTGDVEDGQEQQEETEEKTEEETPDEEEEVEETNIAVTVGGKKLFVYDDFPKDKIPDGFEKSTITYENQEIIVVKNSTGNLVLAYLVDENDKNGAFYVYDEATGNFNDFVEVVGATNRYFVVNPEDTVSIPTGYVETTIELDGKTVKAWYLEEDGIGGFYLVYVVNWEGQKGFYQYDSLEGTFQRVVDTGETVPTSVTPEDTSQDANTIADLENKLNEVQQKYDKDMSTRLKVISILAIVALLGVICIINLLFKIKTIKDDNEGIKEAYLDDDYLDEEEEPSHIDEEKVDAPIVKDKDLAHLEKEKEHTKIEEDDDDFDFIDLDDEDE